MVTKQLPQATFRISDNDLWESFKAKAKANGANASAVFWQFAKAYVDGNVGTTTPSPDGIDERIDAALEAKVDFAIGNISRVAREQYESLVAVVAQSMIDIDERIDTRIEAAQKSILSRVDEHLSEFFDRIRVLEVATTAQSQGMEIGIQDVQNMIDVAFSDREERLDSLEEMLSNAISAPSPSTEIFDAISPLLARLEALENNLGESTAPANFIQALTGDRSSASDTDGSSLENVAAPSIENPLDGEGLSVAFAASAKPKITYQLNRDGSVVLRSLRGITLKALKRMSDAELKAIGLFRTLIGADEKFFPLDPDAIASSPQPKSTERSPKSKAILTRPDALAIAKNFGFLGTGQNLYDWAKAALTSKSEESKLANSEKLAAVGLVAAFTPENRPAWIAKMSLNPEPIS